MTTYSLKKAMALFRYFLFDLRGFHSFLFYISLYNTWMYLNVSDRHTATLRNEMCLTDNTLDVSVPG